MHERLRDLRKTLKLSQDSFGEKIGLSGGGISLLEKGKRNFTDQNIKAICREFSVDYIWLTTGDGEMFVDSDDEFSLDKFAKTHSATINDYKLIRNYLSLDPSIRTQIQSLFIFGE